MFKHRFKQVTQYGLQPVRRRILLVVGTLFAACLIGSPAHAAVSAIDDAGNNVTLAIPARRIVSLAPHATELLYAAGAGRLVVGVSQYSDYPPPARHVTSIGSSAAVDLEKILLLKPDLVVAWRSGNSAAQIARLRQLAIPVFESEPQQFATIASSLERLSKLAGTDAVGQAAAAAFRSRLESLRNAARGRPTVRVFYQIWRKPLMTLNDSHFMSTALLLCGGKNIFGTLPQLAPTVSREAVLTQNPEAIVSAGGDPDPFSSWMDFPQITAVARHNLFALNPNHVSRPGPRILDGVAELCAQLEVARSRR